MRTTITFEDDVAMRLKHLFKNYHGTFKSFINEVLRAGIRDYAQKLKGPKKKLKSFTQPEDLGRLLIDNLDDISEVLDRNSSGTS